MSNILRLKVIVTSIHLKLNTEDKARISFKLFLLIINMEPTSADAVIKNISIPFAV